MMDSTDPIQQPSAGAGQGGARHEDAPPVNPRGEPKRRRLVESPWFWGYLFACGAAAGLLLGTPKYRTRQAQLEKQYRARVAAGQTTEIPGVIASTDQPGNTFVPLWPLFALCAVVVLVVGAGLAWTQFRARTGSPAGRTDRAADLGNSL